MSRFLRALKTLLTRRLVLEFDKVEFVYERLTWKRLSNWLLAELSCLLRSSRVWAYPTHLQVEPTDICNLRCPLCHVVTEDRPRGMLAPEDFRRIIDETGDRLLFLHFWGWGEPMMNPDFMEMVRYAKDKGLKVISSTNGHFFEEGMSIDRLIDSGLDVLILALDGVDRETYERYRREGDFDLVIRGVQAFLARRRERGASSPRINLRMLVTRENEDQVQRMKELAVDLGVDIFTLKTLCHFDNEAVGESLVPCNPDYRRFQYDAGGHPVRIDNPCKKLWNHPTIYRDGTVYPCDYHTAGELDLGNAFSGNGRGFAGVWFGDPFRGFRARFTGGDRSGTRCERCALNFADVDRCVSYAFDVKASSRQGSLSRS
jgi:MoaA/NifB/PqqE/SkfB family radical SAM enzyme